MQICCFGLSDASNSPPEPRLGPGSGGDALPLALCSEEPAAAIADGHGYCTAYISLKASPDRPKAAFSGQQAHVVVQATSEATDVPSNSSEFDVEACLAWASSCNTPPAVPKGCCVALGSSQPSAALDLASAIYIEAPGASRPSIRGIQAVQGSDCRAYTPHGVEADSATGLKTEIMAALDGTGSTSDSEQYSLVHMATAEGGTAYGQRLAAIAASSELPCAGPAAVPAPDSNAAGTPLSATPSSMMEWVEQQALLSAENSLAAALQPMSYLTVCSDDDRQQAVRGVGAAGLAAQELCVWERVLTSARLHQLLDLRPPEAAAGQPNEVDFDRALVDGAAVPVAPELLGANSLRAHKHRFSIAGCSDSPGASAAGVQDTQLAPNSSVSCNSSIAGRHKLAASHAGLQSLRQSDAGSKLQQKLSLTDKLLVQLAEAAAGVMQGQHHSGATSSCEHGSSRLMQAGQVAIVDGSASPFSVHRRGYSTAGALDVSNPAVFSPTKGRVLSASSDLVAAALAYQRQRQGRHRQSTPGELRLSCESSVFKSSDSGMSSSSTSSGGSKGKVLTAANRAELLQQVSAALATGAKLEDLLKHCNGQKRYSSRGSRQQALQQQQSGAAAAGRSASRRQSESYSNSAGGRMSNKLLLRQSMPGHTGARLGTSRDAQTHSRKASTWGGASSNSKQQPTIAARVDNHVAADNPDASSPGTSYHHVVEEFPAPASAAATAAVPQHHSASVDGETIPYRMSEQLSKPSPSAPASPQLSQQAGVGACTGQDTAVSSAGSLHSAAELQCSQSLSQQECDSRQSVSADSPAACVAEMQQYQGLEQQWEAMCQHLQQQQQGSSNSGSSSAAEYDSYTSGVRGQQPWQQAMEAQSEDKELGLADSDSSGGRRGLEGYQHITTVVWPESSAGMATGGSSSTSESSAGPLQVLKGLTPASAAAAAADQAMPLCTCSGASAAGGSMPRRASSPVSPAVRRRWPARTIAQAATAPATEAGRLREGTSAAGAASRFHYCPCCKLEAVCKMLNGRCGTPEQSCTEIRSQGKHLNTHTASVGTGSCCSGKSKRSNSRTASSAADLKQATLSNVNVEAADAHEQSAAPAAAEPLDEVAITAPNLVAEASRYVAHEATSQQAAAADACVNATAGLRQRSSRSSSSSPAKARKPEASSGIGSSSRPSTPTRHGRDVGQAVTAGSPMSVHGGTAAAAASRQASRTVAAGLQNHRRHRQLATTATATTGSSTVVGQRSAAECNAGSVAPAAAVSKAEESQATPKHPSPERCMPSLHNGSSIKAAKITSVASAGGVSAKGSAMAPRGRSSVSSTVDHQHSGRLTSPGKASNSHSASSGGKSTDQSDQTVRPPGRFTSPGKAKSNLRDSSVSCSSNLTDPPQTVKHSAPAGPNRQSAIASRGGRATASEKAAKAATAAKPVRQLTVTPLQEAWVARPAGASAVPAEPLSPRTAAVINHTDRPQNRSNRCSSPSIGGGKNCRGGSPLGMSAKHLASSSGGFCRDASPPTKANAAQAGKSRLTSSSSSSPDRQARSPDKLMRRPDSLAGRSSPGRWIDRSPEKVLRGPDSQAGNSRSPICVASSPDKISSGRQASSTSPGTQHRASSGGSASSAPPARSPAAARALQYSRTRRNSSSLGASCDVTCFADGGVRHGVSSITSSTAGSSSSSRRASVIQAANPWTPRPSSAPPARPAGGAGSSANKAMFSRSSSSSRFSTPLPVRGSSAAALTAARLPHSYAGNLQADVAAATRDATLDRATNSSSTSHSSPMRQNSQASEAGTEQGSQQVLSTQDGLCPAAAVADDAAVCAASSQPSCVDCRSSLAAPPAAAETTQGSFSQQAPMHIGSQAYVMPYLKRLVIPNSNIKAISKDEATGLLLHSCPASRQVTLANPTATTMHQSGCATDADSPASAVSSGAAAAGAVADGLSGILALVKQLQGNLAGLESDMHQLHGVLHRRGTSRAASGGSGFEQGSVGGSSTLGSQPYAPTLRAVTKGFLEPGLQHSPGGLLPGGGRKAAEAMSLSECKSSSSSRTAVHQPLQEWNEERKLEEACQLCRASSSETSSSNHQNGTPIK